jgi:hypothetical protein
VKRFGNQNILGFSGEPEDQTWFGKVNYFNRKSTVIHMSEKCGEIN